MGYGETKILSALPLAVDDLKCAVLSETRPHLLCHSSNSALLSVWDVSSQEPLKLRKTIDHCADSIAISSDNSCIALGLDNGLLEVLALHQNDSLFSVGAHSAPTCSVDFHPFSKLVATSSLDSWVKIWDLRCKTHFRCFQLNSSSSYARRIRFSPDGSWVAGACDNACSILLDIISNKVIHHFPQESSVAFVEFHPSELMLCSASTDCKVHFWDLGDFTHISSFSITDETLSSIVFHCEGSCIFTGTRRGSIMAFGWDPSELYDCIDTGSHDVFCMAHSKSKIVSLVGMDDTLNLLETVYQISESFHSSTGGDIIMEDDSFPTHDSTLSNRTFTRDNVGHSLTGSSKQSPLVDHLSDLDHKSQHFSPVMPVGLNFLHISSRETGLIVTGSSGSTSTQHSLEASLSRIIKDHDKIFEILSRRNTAYSAVNRMIKTKNYVGALKSAENHQDPSVMMDLVRLLLESQPLIKDFPTVCVVQILKNILAHHHQNDYKFVADSLTKLLRRGLDVLQIKTPHDCRSNIDDKALFELQQIHKLLRTDFPHIGHPSIAYISLVSLMYTSP